MAKLVLIKENGESEVLKDNVPESTGEFDVLLRSDYFSTKLWSTEDIALECKIINVMPTKNLINMIVDNESDSMDEELGECTDVDWEIIKDAIYRQVKKEVSDINDIILYDEDTLEYEIQGEIYRCPLDSDSNDMWLSLRMTVKRIIDAIPCENKRNEFLYNNMRIEKNPPDLLEDEIWTDIYGEYGIRGKISSWRKVV